MQPFSLASLPKKCPPTCSKEETSSTMISPFFPFHIHPGNHAFLYSLISNSLFLPWKEKQIYSKSSPLNQDLAGLVTLLSAYQLPALPTPGIRHFPATGQMICLLEILSGPLPICEVQSHSFLLEGLLSKAPDSSPSFLDMQVLLSKVQPIAGSEPS
jgi:hypothetical protein